MASRVSGFRMAALAAAVLGAALALSGCGDKSPESVAVDFAKAGYEGDVEGFIDKLDMDKMKGITKSDLSGKLKPGVEDAKRKLADKGGLKDITVVRSVVTQSGSHALVTLKSTFGNGSSDEDKFYLNKNSSGDWKVELGTGGF
ncbi:MAG: DUF4878 domain-containing protein [Succinivibrio sp.]